MPWTSRFYSYTPGIDLPSINPFSGEILYFYSWMHIHYINFEANQSHAHTYFCLEKERQFKDSYLDGLQLALLSFIPLQKIPPCSRDLTQMYETCNSYYCTI